jgi:hypothetical protein
LLLVALFHLEIKRKDIVLQENIEMQVPATITDRASLTISLKNEEVFSAKYLIEH